VRVIFGLTFGDIEHPGILMKLTITLTISITITISISITIVLDLV